MEPEVTIDGVRMSEVSLTPGERHLSRRLSEHLPGGEVRLTSLAVVALSPEGQVSITPFGGETAFTLYHDRPLHLFRTDDGPRLYEEVVCSPI